MHSFEIYGISGRSKQHTCVLTTVMLVWGLLRLAPTNSTLLKQCWYKVSNSVISKLMNAHYLWKPYSQFHIRGKETGDFQLLHLNFNVYTVYVIVKENTQPLGVETILPCE